MFSYFGKVNSNLAFRTDSNDFARSAAVYRFMETALNDWLDGREKAYAVHQVIRESRRMFGPAGEIPCQLLNRALAPPDDPSRLAACIRRCK